MTTATRAAGTVAEAEFEDLWRSTYADIVRYLKQRAASDAEDVACEAFLRAWKFWAGWSPTGTRRGWVYTIARNALVDAQRSAACRPAVCCNFEGFEPADPTDAATVVSNQISDRAAIVAALTGLPPNQRRVIELRYLRDMSVAQVAEVTGWTVGAVKSSTRNALHALGAALASAGVAR